MSSAPSLRDFIRERLASAADEIFKEFDKTIIHYEEELNRQRKLLKTCLKPLKHLQESDLQLQKLRREEEVSNEQLFSDHEVGFMLGLEELEPQQMKDDDVRPEPPPMKDNQEETKASVIQDDHKEAEAQQIKYEREELCISPEKQHLRLNEEVDTCTVNFEEERDHREPELDRKLIVIQISSEHENLNLPQSHEEESGSIIESVQILGGHRNNVDDSKVREEAVLSHQHLINQERDFILDQEEPKPQEMSENMEGVEHQLFIENQKEKDPHQMDSHSEPLLMKEELEEPETDHLEEKPPQIKDLQGELFISLDMGQPVLKQEMGTSRVNPLSEEGEHREPNTEQLLTQRSLKPEEENQQRNHDDSASGDELNQNRCLKSKGNSIDNPIVKRLKQTHTNEKLCSCRLCVKNVVKRFLNKHMRTNTDERPCSCVNCGKSLTQRANLSGHIKSHTSEKVSSCITCGKSFNSRANLSQHRKTQMDEKQFPCLTCGKHFKERGALSMHMKTHTSEKPFPCMACGKRFSAKRNYISAHESSHR